MKRELIALGFCLAGLAGCASVSEMGARLDARIDSLFAANEEENYVPVVYPAELARYPAARDNSGQPYFTEDSSAEYAAFQFNHPAP
jgi:hypothetical protein